ncbi:MAG: polyprenol monophosphomannose synthase [Solirubrobacteraceae bacterium]
MAPWIVLPTYNEAASLPRVVAAARTALPEARILVVDDDSPDGTGAIAETLEGVDVLHRPAKAGLGAAYVAGFDRVLAEGATEIFEMDADGSHDPADLPRLLAAVRGGADVALGSRYVRGGGVENWPLLRRAVSRSGCLYARMVLRVPVRDLTGGLKCFRADALRAVDHAAIRSHGYTFQVELTYRALRRGLRVAELPIIFHDRTDGESKMTPRIALEAAWLVPALRLSSRPHARR